ncbi:MAG TPA: hypothetical protein PLO33_07690, partial [Kouleothrix sp.]|nr:hypothetical protein [Kouleothrix sp.]
MKTNMQFNPPLLRTSRGRHLLEALAVLVLIVAVALGISYSMTRRVAPATPVVANDPAAPSVMGYIRAHEALLPAVANDPAAPSVMGYIRAHEA